MSAECEFPANSVLAWYADAESMLVDFLAYVPYCDEHEGVWSPTLVTILQETCSQLDSLWKWEVVHVRGGRNNKIDITDYFEHFGRDMAPRWLVFWSDPPRTLAPFATWKNATKFTKKESPEFPLDWWKEGYQPVKHNRLEKRTCATLKRAVEALAALFLAVIRCENCRDGLCEKHWLSWDDSAGMPFDPVDCLKEDFGPLRNTGRCNVTQMAVECTLFSYPVGLCSGVGPADKKYPYWKGRSSNRFKTWYYDYCQTL